MPVPVDAAGWEGLIAGFRQCMVGTLPADAADRHLQGVLAAPAAVALWLRRVMPELLRRDAMKVLVVGAASVDAVDEGRWYGAIAALTGYDLRVSATLVGDELDSAFRSPLAACAPQCETRLERIALKAFLDTHPGPVADVAVIFHPGFQKNQGWLRDGSLLDLMNRGVPVVIASFEEDEFEMDSWVAEAYGYSASAEPLLNPCFLDVGTAEGPVHWGRALWQLSPPTADADVFRPERLAELELLTAMSMHSYLHVTMPVPPPGAAAALRGSDGREISYVHVFDGLFMNPIDGALLQLSADGSVSEAGRLGEGEVAAYPAMARRHLDRAVWAAGIKARYLPGGVAATRAPAEAAASLRNDMLDRAMRYFDR